MGEKTGLRECEHGPLCVLATYMHYRVAPSFLSLPLTVAVTTLSSFQGYRKTRAVITDCLMTDAEGTKRALITSSPVKGFQHITG